MEAVTTLRSMAVAPEHRRWLALAVVCLGYVAMVIDMTIVNVALPAIQRDLGFSQASLAWVIDAYLLVYGGFILLGGRLGDLIGHKRVFLGGVAIFTVASLACGVSQTQGELIGARVVQGLGAAGSSAVTVAIIVRTFTAPVERAKAMSAYTFVMSGGASLGLVLGGVLTQAIDWHWIFFVNVPIGLLAFVGGAKLLDDEPGIGLDGGVDVAGSLLVTAATMLGVYAIVTASTHGWTSAHTLVPGTVAIVGLAGFALLQMRLANPIVPPRVVALRGVWVSSVARALMIVGAYGSFFLGSLYLEHVLGYDTLAIGFAFLPQTAVVAVLSSGVTARLMRAVGPRAPLYAGLVAFLVGLVLLACAGTGASYAPLIVVSMLAIGLGAGLVFLPLLTIAMRDVPAADAGLGSAVTNVSTQIGAALGVAVLGTVSSSHTASLVRAGHAHADALVGGYHLGLFVAAGCVAAAGLVALALPRDEPARATATSSTAAR